MIAGFSLTGHRQHAGGPRAERDEADVAERDDARVADEDVERDDDRDLDERVGEVASGSTCETARAEQRRADDEHRRAERAPAARRGASYALDRSPARRRARRAGRAGRGSRPTKRNVGRYWLWFVGSAPPSRPLAKPIEKPPSVAGIGRFMPPSTTPASTTIVSRSAKSGVTSGVCTVSITATTAASAPEMQHRDRDHAVRAHAEHARRLEVHRRGAHVQADRRPLEQQRQSDAGRPRRRRPRRS